MRTLLLSISFFMLCLIGFSVKAEDNVQAPPTNNTGENSNNSLFGFEPSTPDPKDHEIVITSGNDTKLNIQINANNDSASSCSMTTCPKTKALSKKILSEFAMDLNNYKSSSEKCYDVQQKAKYICREETNPQLKSNLATINSVLSVANASSVVDKCSSIGKIMDIAQKGLTLYTTACGALQAGCSMSCKSAYNTLSTILEKKEKWVTEIDNAHFDDQSFIDENINKSASNPQLLQFWNSELVKLNSLRNKVRAALDSFERQAATDFKKSNGTTAYRLEKCDKDYPALLASAGLGILSTINSAKQANNCKCDAGGCAPAVAQLDCNGKDSAKQECICQLNPRMQGCPGADVQGKIAFGGGTNGPAKSNLKTDANTGDLNLGDDAQKSPEKTETVKGDIAGAPTGGSGMGDGGSLGGGSAGGGSAGKNLKPGSVLEGYGGGGGGAYGSYNSQLAALASKLGIAKPVERNVAGEAWTKQVTTSAGKSNWEKVKDRYNDNQTTLIGR